jgi:RimJ/RimL family protein N-acetyltransferase
MSIRIKSVDKSDKQGLKKLILNALLYAPNAFSVTYGEYEAKSTQWWDIYLDSFIYDSSQKYFIALEGTEYVGICGLVLETRIRKKHVGMLVWLFVEQEYRGNNIGNLLIDRVFEFAKTNKIEKINLLVNSSQLRAINLYTKIGFSKKGVYQKELKVGDHYFDVLLMEKFIK